jgi:hypothetical protein
MTASVLENLLLKPQATELSYNYIETLLLDRISSGSLGKVDGQDDFSIIMDVFAKSMHRAGSGWGVVVSKKVANRIVVGTLKQIHSFDEDSERVIESLLGLVNCCPVLIKCNYTEIISELIRIVKLSAIPSVSLWRMINVVLISKLPGNMHLYTIASYALGNIPICHTGYEAVACLEVLVTCLPFIRTYPQLLNTAIGVSQAAVNRFVDNFVVRKLSFEILAYSSRVESMPAQATQSAFLNQSQVPPPVSVVADSPLTRPVAEVHGGNSEISIKEVITTQSYSEEPGAPMDEETSPRSSCPSLDL